MRERRGKGQISGGLKMSNLIRGFFTRLQRSDKDSATRVTATILGQRIHGASFGNGLTTADFAASDRKQVTSQILCLHLNEWIKLSNLTSISLCSELSVE